MPVNHNTRFARIPAAAAAGIALVVALVIALVAGPSATATVSDRASGDRHAAGRRSTGVDDSVRLNQVQVIGSHNSYHQVPPAKEVALRRQFIGAADDQLEYRHAPLPDQFQSQKVRQIELDAFLDPAGGKYATPLLRTATNGGPYDPVMNQPGIKVFHIQDVDYHSSCLTLKICLQQIKGWSDAHPAHLPIAILMELKDDPLTFGSFEFVKPDPWTAPAMDTLDTEIRSVFPPAELITPDDIRGNRATLEQAVLQNGWPTLGQSRGKVMFMMDNSGAKRTAYLQGHPSLTGRVLFTNSNPGQPDAAFVERNDAKGSGADIRSLVQRGYVVRTRADADTMEARQNDPSTRDAALASGAQWVSTDYPVPNYGVGFATTYFAQIPGGTVARCNPVNAPPRCVSSALDTVFTAPPAITPPSVTAPVATSLPPPPPPPPATQPPPAAPGGASPALPVTGSPSLTG